MRDHSSCVKDEETDSEQCTAFLPDVGHWTWCHLHSADVDKHFHLAGPLFAMFFRQLLLSAPQTCPPGFCQRVFEQQCHWVIFLERQLLLLSRVALACLSEWVSAVSGGFQELSVWGVPLTRG